MPVSRPVAQSVTVSTATGTFGPVNFGVGFRWASLAMSNTGDTGHTWEGNVQGSLGGSGVWSNLIALTTGNTTGQVYLWNTTGGAVFDKLRVNLSANNSTVSVTAWLIAGGN